MNVTFRFCFRSPLKSLKLPVFKGLSTDLGSHSFLHISFYPLYQVTHKGSSVTVVNIDCYKIPKQIGDTPSDTLEVRKHAFGEKLIPYMEQYGKALIREFFDYWTEHNENGKKMRFEKEKTFEISRRLARWSKNNNNNKPSKSSLPVGMNLQNSNNSERYKLDDRWNK